MASVTDLTRALVDIDSTTGREQEVGGWLSAFLRQRGYRITEQPVADGRFNVFATLDLPRQEPEARRNLQAAFDNLGYPLFSADR